MTGGRTVPWGTEGTVFWYGGDTFRSNRYASFYRVGLITDSGRRAFIAAENVTALDDACDQVQQLPISIAS